jgi:hypothetical protein
MAKITLTLNSITSKVDNDVSTIEADAKDALAWLVKEGTKLAQGGPRAIAALGVLLAAVQAELTDVGSGNLAQAIQDIKPVWSDVKAFVADFGIKL